MATTLVTEKAAAVPAGRYDRIFYTGLAALMALTVFGGFGSTYYFRIPSGTAATLSGGTITPTLHLHALLFTGWVVLFLVQCLLIASRNVRIHRGLGYASLALAAGMIIVGLRTAIESGARGAAPPGIDALTFLIVPVTDIALFTGFYTAAMLNRRNKDTHKRLMLLAYVSIITAAVARFPGMLALGPLVFFGLSFLFVVAGVVYDLISRGRIHRAYAWGAPILLLSVPLRLVLSGTAAWQSIARWLTA